jgi:DNA-directed RNA polymerase subunit M/transcription elongation factor TFIIS
VSVADEDAVTDGEDSRMICAECGQNETVSIRMKVGGEELTFRRCARCEANAWESQSGRLSLDRVLELARSAR